MSKQVTFDYSKAGQYMSFEELKNIDAVKSTLDYLIDGAVIKVNNVSDRKMLGFTEKFPKWAIAYKFKPEEATTILKDVKWQVSRTGKINPLAILEPIELCGATIKRATLNNMADIKKKDIKINSRVFIRRSNEVIPEVIASAEHYKNSIDIEPPKSCPVCGGEVVKKGAFYYCTNKDDCATRIISELSHFASKEAMDIEGLSDKTCELLYNELNVKNFDDIYKLNKSQLMELEGFKEKKADNLLASIEKSKNITLEKFITALGINNIGKKNAKTLAQNFKDIQKIINANKEELLKLKDFGEIMAESVVEYFKNGEKLKVVNNLLNFITFNEETNANSGIFNGKVVLITGKLESMKRGSAHQEIIKRGGSIAEDMTKSVNLLICGDKPGSKLVKAEKAGVEIIDEKKFLDLLNSSQTIE